MARPFRFGMVFTGHASADAFDELARRVEGQGFSTLLVADHLSNPMACGPMIVAAANATTTLRVGSYVYDNDFRHPVVLAKEAATIDVLSRGRLEFGIGAGWDKEEYDAVGLPFDPPRVRVDRLEEALDVIGRLFAGGPVDFEGEHYRLAGIEGAPTPVQRPIPLLIGGGGPRMLRLAAARAQIVGLVPPSLPGGGLDRSKFSDAAMDAMIGALEAGIAAAARTDGGPERGLLVWDVMAHPGDVAVRGMSPETVGASPWAFVGEPGAIVDVLHERRERWGLSYYVCFADETGMDRFVEVVRRLAA